MKLPEPQDIDAIMEDAYTRHRKYHYAVRGQTVTEKDGVEYWMVMATIDWVKNENKSLLA